MECPHLAHGVRLGGEREIEAACTKDLPLVCAVCGTEKSTWLCLHCGAVHCGRYVAGHAMQHHENNTQHCVCMDCENLAVFCYSCDEYVVNDTTSGQIEKLRRSAFQKAEHKEAEESWTSSSSTSSSSSSSSSPTLSPQSGSAASQRRGTGDDPEALWKAEVVVRNLRPRTRKRSHSLDGSRNAENRPAAKRRNSKITKEKKVVGLRNLGNTCFMNVVLQSFNNISHFCEYLTQMPSLEGIAFDEPPTHRGRIVAPGRAKELSDALLAEELRKVLLGLSLGGSNGQAISPECLFLVIWKVVPRFRGYQQQDAHEFLTYMLDRLHTELLQLLPRLGHEPLGLRGKQSIVTAVFGGTLLSVVHCMNCRTDSKTHEPFQDLSLDIPDRLQRRAKEQEEVCCLTYSLSRFFKVEELADSELYFCDNCMGKQRSTKRFWIHRLPNVLCLHIKRFRWCNSYRSKVDTQVDFPMESLDMSAFTVRGVTGSKLGTQNSHLYDLAAVIVHHGSGAGTGHYTAFAVHDGQWFHFNDSSVRPASADSVAKCKPYILFYVRKEFSIPPPL
ncbi:ubiquitin carboxyl-terminal hydrolase 3 [Orussus abietinus]|uniref:ubiquitin carboxyl-terminal hydrolase 3 n=1 Tax=Orussus abietinus TaxID=222816 RepID=UPI0006254E3F|nr:ubiquitin carboxyl-terminal hydrolase 3 [Orussus abietinus]XP_012271875.1 ubiquitin carboxyl-terminal hydrolase 3 [Orussus abietinus]